MIFGKCNLKVVMELVFLGTSAGTPTKTRNVAAVAIKMASAKPWYLVDCGEGTQHQILHTNLSLMHLQAIFISHIHGDHCYGLPGILASASMLGRTEPLTIVAPGAIKHFLEGVQAGSQLTLSFKVNFIEIEPVKGQLEFDDFLVEIAELSHTIPCFAFCFIENNIERKLDVEKLKNDGVTPGPVWGFLQSGEDVMLPSGEALICDEYLLERRLPRKVVIAGDNDTPALLAEYSEQVDVLIHEATYTAKVEEKVGNEYQHCSAKRIAEFAEDASIANLVLTHFSPRYQNFGNGENSIAAIEAEAQDAFNGGLFLANDFDVFYLNHGGCLVRKV